MKNSGMKASQDDGNRYNGGKFLPESKDSSIKEKSGGAAQVKVPPTVVNPQNSTIIMEGFIGLPKNMDKSEGLGQKECGLFTSGAEYDDEQDCSY
jgi:hypothetical protein